MMLPWLIAILFTGGFVAWAAEEWRVSSARWIALGTLFITALLIVTLYPGTDAGIVLKPNPVSSAWFADFNQPWIPRFGIRFHLAMDGLSYLLVSLTVLLGVMAVSSSWTEITRQQGFFYFNILACLAGTVGVFLVVDLFLLFFFWELMIIPMYFLISIWGHENKTYAAIKFVLFTQVSSLLLLVAIILLVLFSHAHSGVYSFDYFNLLNTKTPSALAFWLMLGFFIAFTVKLPGVPLHTWLPDAHTQAPTGGSVILAGVMLKTGAYGLMRFAIPLFPEAAQQFAPIAMTLGCISVLYAAIMAFAQTDLKRLIAYTSVSHMGFVLVGLYSWNFIAWQGAMVTLLAHGVSAAALFMIAGAIQERLHTRDMEQMGGLWQVLPKLSAVTLFFALASLGLPSLGNFIGEFLVLLGTYKSHVVLTSITAIVLILSPIYALVIIQKAFHGVRQKQSILPDFKAHEQLVFGVLVITSIWLGVTPGTVLDIASPALKQTAPVLEVGVSR